MPWFSNCRMHSLSDELTPLTDQWPIDLLSYLVKRCLMLIMDLVLLGLEVYARFGQDHPVTLQGDHVQSKCHPCSARHSSLQPDNLPWGTAPHASKWTPVWEPAIQMTTSYAHMLELQAGRQTITKGQDVQQHPQRDCQWAHEVIFRASIWRNAHLGANFSKQDCKRTGRHGLSRILSNVKPTRRQHRRWALCPIIHTLAQVLYMREC